jgi:preprotein translocase subunit SecE
MVETTDKQVEPVGGWQSGVLIALAIVLIVGGLAAYYGLTQQPLWARWLALLAGLALGAGALSLSAPGRTFWEFVMSSRVELRKMIWASMEDTRKMTGFVIIAVFLLGLFFWLIDVLLGLGTHKLLGGGS